MNRVGRQLSLSHLGGIAGGGGGGLVRAQLLLILGSRLGKSLLVIRLRRDIERRFRREEIQEKEDIERNNAGKRGSRRAQNEATREPPDRTMLHSHKPGMT